MPTPDARQTTGEIADAARIRPKRITDPRMLAELREERAALRPLLLGDWDAYDRHRRAEAGCREVDFAPQHAAIRMCVLRVMATCEAEQGRRDIAARDFFAALTAEGVVGGGGSGGKGGGMYAWRYAALKETFAFPRLPLWYVVGIATGEDF